MLMFLVAIALPLFQLCSAQADPCADTTGVIFVPNPDGGCDEYFTCLNGEAFPKTCPAGFYFDFDRQQCYFSEQVVCGDAPPGAENPCAGQPQWMFVPRPSGGCGAYYRCDNEIGTPLDCPEGFYFDLANQMCNFPELVICEGDEGTNGGTPTAPTPDPTDPINPIDPTNPTDPTNGETTTAEVPTAPTPPMGENYTCAGRPDGSFIPDIARGCTAFQVCVNGVGREEVCPAPFYFDFIRQICNWQENVNCVTA